MENIIMPELITPAFAEVMASKPEILDQLLGMQMNEETITNRSLELNADNMPKVMKLLFCNINIKIDSSENIDCEAWNSEESKKNTMAIQSGKEGIRRTIEHLKRLEVQLVEKCSQVEMISNEVAVLREKVVIIETRMRECTKLLKLVCKEPFYRKLSYRYKMDLNSLTSSLIHEKRALVEKIQLLNYEKASKDELEEKIRRKNGRLLEKLL